LSRVADCPFCAEPLPDPPPPKCRHCGEALVDRAELHVGLAGVAPDPSLAARATAWPDDSLVRALRDHVDDYPPAQQRALLDEVLRRGLPLPAQRVARTSLPGRIVLIVGAALLAYLVVSVGAVIVLGR
jgi:hypothetical protein